MFHDYAANAQCSRCGQWESLDRLYVGRTMDLCESCAGIAAQQGERLEGADRL